MEGNLYQEKAMVTLNKKLNKKEILLNGVMGLCGEAGETIDIVKKHLFQGHDLDREKIIDELGDVLWYIAETSYALDCDFDEIMNRNIDKLKKRYPEGFDETRSINR